MPGCLLKDAFTGSLTAAGRLGGGWRGGGWGRSSPDAQEPLCLRKGTRWVDRAGLQLGDGLCNSRWMDLWRGTAYLLIGCPDTKRDAVKDGSWRLLLSDSFCEAEFGLESLEFQKTSRMMVKCGDVRGHWIKNQQQSIHKRLQTHRPGIRMKDVDCDHVCDHVCSWFTGWRTGKQIATSLWKRNNRWNGPFSASPDGRKTGFWMIFDFPNCLQNILQVFKKNLFKDLSGSCVKIQVLF